MFVREFFAAALLACSALAAPTQPRPTELSERDAGYVSGYFGSSVCDAQINVHVVPAIWPRRGADMYWKVDLRTADNFQIGHWGQDNMIKNPLEKDRLITTNRGPTFRIRGQPGDSSKEETKDHLTLAYDWQEWNSKDCYEYKYEAPNVFLNNGQFRHSWKCQFQCPSSGLV